MTVRFASGPAGSPHVGNAPGAVADRNAASNAPGGREATLERFRELRERSSSRLDPVAAKAIVRELKAVGGDLRAVRRALTGRERGPALWSVVAALSREETLRRVDGAL